VAKIASFVASMLLLDGAAGASAVVFLLFLLEPNSMWPLLSLSVVDEALLVILC
jgi:hypothetical protein